ncbi:MAG TPA: hypothetical protein VMH00_13910 [Candidatus Limnocylindrales bacterium]|nr:hypothetical protein [Candidatus Limnocylindrales bacterium]
MIETHEATNEELVSQRRNSLERRRTAEHDPQHPKTVALLCGSLVLFAITADAPAVTASQLLAARKSGAQSWQVETARGPLEMLPFIAIDAQPYSTYLNVS